MRYEENPGRVVIRQADRRFVIDLPAKIVADEGEPLPARLINLSRHGFRVTVARSFAAGAPLRLEVDNWPRLPGRVVWCQGGRAGCLFDTPPSPRIFAMMCASTLSQDRDAF